MLLFSYFAHLAAVLINSSTLTTWCEELTHWKRPWFWERLRTGEEGDSRGWDGWTASPTQWIWVWASPRRWWRTGKPDMLQSVESQRVGHHWVIVLRWSLGSMDDNLLTDFYFLQCPTVEILQLLWLWYLVVKKKKKKTWGITLRNITIFPY